MHRRAEVDRATIGDLLIGDLEIGEVALGGQGVDGGEDSGAVGFEVGGVAQGARRATICWR
jgi:hypothetical protein